MASEAAARSAESRLASEIMGRRVKVTVEDGRTIHGSLVCLDPQGNVVLGGAEEEVGPADRPEFKPMGHIIVPEAQRVAVSVSLSDAEDVLAKRLAKARR